MRAPVAGLSSVTQPSPLLRNLESVTHTWFPAEATAPPGSLSANGVLERVLTSRPVAATSMTEPCGREPSADLAPTLITSQTAAPFAVIANGTLGRDMTRIRAPVAALISVSALLLPLATQTWLASAVIARGPLSW